MCVLHILHLIHVCTCYVLNVLSLIWTFYSEIKITLTRTAYQVKGNNCMKEIFLPLFI